MNRLIATSLLDTYQGPGHTKTKSDTDAGVHVVLFYRHHCAQERKERATRVRVCNYVKIETGQNFPPVLKTVTRTAQAV